MIKRLALSIGVLLFCHASLAAQSLASGSWTGSVTGPGGNPLVVTYEVHTTGDSIAILIKTPDRGDYPVTNAKLAGETLTFAFQPGPTVECKLVRQADESFLGECAGEDDMRATMVMKPPAKPAG
jgi:hypothetical protein